MKEVMHLYVESEKYDRQRHPSENEGFHVTSGVPGIQNLTASTGEGLKCYLRIEVTFIISVLEKYANEKRIEFQIHDITYRAVRKEARKKGIRKTPALVIKDHLITELPSDEKSLLKLLDTLPN